MHASTEATTNTAKSGCFIMASASRPSTLRSVVFCPFASGGVCGSATRLYAAITRHAAAASRNGVVPASTRMNPTTRLMAIHPSVPIVRMGGKSRPGSATCCIVIELVSATVGK